MSLQIFEFHNYAQTTLKLGRHSFLNLMSPRRLQVKAWWLEIFVHNLNPSA